jgi:D-tyrosyl-tRNA(Tyr) deacylase
MRAIVQRVSEASVTVENKQISAINKGILVLLGIHNKDTISDVQEMSKKLYKLKLWPDDQGKPWKKNTKEMEYQMLIVSQFTLYGVLKSNGQPSFHRAMGGEESRLLYDELIRNLKTLLDSDSVHGGSFGDMMNVALINDGPVTIDIEVNGTNDSNLGNMGLGKSN